MEIVNFTPLPALVGGVLIGLGAVLVLLMNGKIAGISGMLARPFLGVEGDTAWRLVFLVGLVVGGALTFALIPSSAEFQLDAGWSTVLVAGFLVGLGTRVGGGCTSGHGVCGLSSGSVRSLVATLAFMAAGFVTVYVVRHVLGGGGAL
jgi:uncharacterized membrane protein YedE/YeeE